MARLLSSIVIAAVAFASTLGVAEGSPRVSDLLEGLGRLLAPSAGAVGKEFFQEFRPEIGEGFNALGDLLRSLSLRVPEGGAADLIGLREDLGRLSAMCGQNGILIERIRDRLDQSVTREELSQKLLYAAAEMRRLEARVLELELQNQSRDRRINMLESDADRTRYRLMALEADQATLRKDLNSSVSRLDLAITSVQASVDSETAKRIFADQYLQSQVDANTSDIAQLREFISPRTKGQTASVLSAEGAIWLLRGKDPISAVRILQLAKAYDQQSQRRVDPGVRLWLALAYRRSGQTTRADEMLAEAVVAERFRRLPEWHYRVIESLISVDRVWMENARYDAVFGVKAPRSIATDGL